LELSAHQTKTFSEAARVLDGTAFVDPQNAESRDNDAKCGNGANRRPAPVLGQNQNSGAAKGACE
jgi:hypothetical protein